MKKTVLAASGLILAGVFSANADIKINLPAGSDITEINYYQVPVAKYAVAKTQDEMGIVQDKVAVKDGKAVIAIPDDKNGFMYNVLVGPRSGAQIYAYPNDNIVIDVTSIQPFEYKASGSAAMDAQNEVNALLNPVMEKQAAIMATGQQPTQEQMAELQDEYSRLMKEYIAENPGSVGAIFAAMNLGGEEFIEAFDRLSEKAKASIVYPIAKKTYEQTQKMVAKEKAQKELCNGTHEAPDFTLDNTEGKPVSLSEFRGKWVILDFWGSWCGWCIKGFPELKEAYAKYKDRLEIIGLDCNEGKEEWLAGVKKYELPWVNLYCPKGDKLLDEFGVSGFPTKAIIDPKGMIRNITAGHNPEFFVELEKLLAE